jgi:hypothetical protein
LRGAGLGGMDAATIQERIYGDLGQYAQGGGACRPIRHRGELLKTV